MHYSYSVYSFTILLHVSRLLVAHHQEVTMYICDNWYVLHVVFLPKYVICGLNKMLHTVKGIFKCNEYRILRGVSKKFGEWYQKTNKQKIQTN
jgi:hypothetical protein